MKNAILVAAGLAAIFGCERQGSDLASRESPQDSAQSAAEPAQPVAQDANSGEGPNCDDVEVTEFVVDAFNTAQDLETMSGVSMGALSGVEDLGVARYASGDWRQTRACAARATLSSGETIDVWYHVKLPQIDDAIGYRVKICTSKYDPINGAGCAAYEKPPAP